MMHRDHADEVKRLLTDPRRLVEMLGISKGCKPQSGGGVVILCPEHDEKTPSCSVTIAPNGLLRAKCFGCDWGADAIGLIAAARGWSTTSQFKDCLVEGALLGRDGGLAAEIRGEGTRDTPKPAPPLESRSEPDYPDGVEVVWEGAGSVAETTDVAAYLTGRAIDPVEAEEGELLRALRIDQKLPTWARYQGNSWYHTGHRIVVRMFDSQGAIRGIRAWRVNGDKESPKRLPPAGCKATALVMANNAAQDVLRGITRPITAIVVEGEPDFVTIATRVYKPVFGLVSGSWTPEFGQRIPAGSRVVIRTHHDKAGEQYCKTVTGSLRKHCQIVRSEP